MHAEGREVTVMTATGIPGAGPGGVLRMTWVQDRPRASWSTARR